MRCTQNKAQPSCGYSSAVERHLAKVNVARSNRVTRLKNEGNRQSRWPSFLHIATERLVRTNAVVEPAQRTSSTTAEYQTILLHARGCEMN